jgi:AraC-like DNA-binding protein
MKEQIDAVRRMQAYIREHLYENITLNDLAEASLYSPWYSHRLFLKWTEYKPADYIRRLRLSKSALILRDQNRKIIDVAFEIGFGSVDGYQRAFYKEFGCNPSEYAEQPTPLYLFMPYDVESQSPGKERIMDKVKTIFVQVVTKPPRKVMIKRGRQATDYWAYCQEVGCEIWGLLTSIKSLSGEPVSLWLPKKYIQPNTSEYVQGVELPLDYDGIIPEGLDMITLPGCEFLQFQGEPFEEEDYQQAIVQVRDAILNYDPSTIGYTWDDTNPRIQLEPIGTRGYIELLPVTKILS